MDIQLKDSVPVQKNIQCNPLTPLPRSQNTHTGLTQQRLDPEILLFILVTCSMRQEERWEPLLVH